MEYPFDSLEDGNIRHNYDTAKKLYDRLKIKDALILLINGCGNGDDADLKLLMGKCYFALGKYDLAEKCYRDAISKDKMCIEAKKLLKELNKTCSKYSRKKKKMTLFVIGRCYI